VTLRNSIGHFIIAASIALAAIGCASNPDSSAIDSAIKPEPAASDNTSESIDAFSARLNQARRYQSEDGSRFTASRDSWSKTS
jgi:hypothetical protein